MAAIDFPNSPTVGQTFTAGTSQYKWNGTAWIANGSASVTISYVNGLQAALDAKAAAITSTAVSSNITLAANGHYFVNTSAARTLTLPATPSLGDEIQVFDATGTAGTYNITIANNSNKINGVLDSALLDVNGVAAVFVWTGSTYGWRMG